MPDTSDPAADPFGDKAGRLRSKVPKLVRQDDAPIDSNLIPRQSKKFDIPSTQLPLPSVARATLIALGWSDAGRFEKVAWRVRFDFDGVPCVLEDQKMGVNLYVFPLAEWEDVASTALADRVITTLQVAIRIAETDIFRPAINEQIAQGRIILLNNILGLRTSYEYLRELAESKRAETPQQLDADADIAEILRASMGFSMRNSAEQRALADAMIMAFFAYLERFLTLALPFSAADLNSIDVGRFLASTWSDKFKQVLDLGAPEVKKIYDRLDHVSNTFRNPRAHGHDKKSRSTMGAVIDVVGAVPVMITGIEATADFGHNPYDDQRSSDITALFDEAVDLIHGPALGHAGHWLSDVLDVHLHPEYVQGYRLPRAEYMTFFERQSLAWERAVNMDF